MIPTATVIHDGLQATPVVTRRLPPPVESRAARDYDLRCNVDDRLYSADELSLRRRVRTPS